MKKIGFLIIIIWVFVSCKTKDDDEKPVNTQTLAWYVNQFPDREIDILIACAASEPESNVVLNIREQNPYPDLHSNSSYFFTLMGVSEDNWVSLIGEKEFLTN